MSLNGVVTACNQKTNSAPGKREHRFMHLFGDDEPVASATDSAEDRMPADTTDLSQRVLVLERDVAELK